jgi:hypothetical protein
MIMQSNHRIRFAQGQCGAHQTAIEIVKRGGINDEIGITPDRQAHPF